MTREAGQPEFSTQQGIENSHPGGREQACHFQSTFTVVAPEHVILDSKTRINWTPRINYPRWSGTLHIEEFSDLILGTRVHGAGMSCFAIRWAVEALLDQHGAEVFFPDKAV
jgi:hypothetical protein